MRHSRNYQTISSLYLKHPETGQWFEAKLQIDAGGILDVLGSKALHSKSGEARECNGDIRVRVSPAKDVPLHVVLGDDVK